MLGFFSEIPSTVIKHDGILILGDGNFSFSRDLASCRPECCPMFATSFDSQQVVFSNAFAHENVEWLAEQPKIHVRHDIDATKLEDYFPQQRFALVIFNFPHVGGKSNIKKCRALLEGVFTAAAGCLHDGGRVLISLCRGQGGTPIDHGRVAYGNTWKVANQAAKAGLILTQIKPFDASDMTYYKQAGYRSKIKNGFFTNSALIHVFIKPNSPIKEINTEENSLYVHLQVVCARAIEFALADIEVPVIKKEFVNKPSKSYHIHPYTHPRNYELKYTFSCPTELIHEFIALLIKTLFKNFLLTLDNKSTSVSTQTYDVDKCPSFAEEMPSFVWKHYLPEVTISYKEQNSEDVKYKNVHFNEYNPTDLELKYAKSRFVLPDDNESICRGFIDEYCVFSLSETDDTVCFCMDMNNIFIACYQLTDLRYLWSGDQVFKSSILEHVACDMELGCVHRPTTLNTLIVHPVCYRHDMCLWLDSEHTERHLYEIVRTHSTLQLNKPTLLLGVFLLRLINYEESQLVSYCYRLIYSSVDGALSHLQTVRMQNNVRRALLDAGFQLR